MAELMYFSDEDNVNSGEIACRCKTELVLLDREGKYRYSAGDA
jgi:hypothetical protein